MKNKNRPCADFKSTKWLNVVQHPPRGNVYLVHVDPAAGDPSYAGGECEEGDDQDVVAANINHSHEEGCRRQQSCREMVVETRTVLISLSSQLLSTHQKGVALLHLQCVIPIRLKPMSFFGFIRVIMRHYENECLNLLLSTLILFLFTCWQK